MAGAGSAYTAALAATGKNGGGKDNVESFNGSSWTEIALKLITQDQRAELELEQILQLLLLVVQIQVTNLVVAFARDEEYDGSSWTETTDINTGSI